jgi:NTE family protein
MGIAHITPARPAPPRGRSAIVLSGGGARGAYEAGVVAYVLESVYPEIGDRFEFDIVSGTSVGGIHAGYLAATADASPRSRARGLREIWTKMALENVLRVSARDLVGVPLRALGVDQLIRGASGEAKDLLGGLVDITPLEHLVDRSIPWKKLRDNLDGRRLGALSISCTEIASGNVTVFLDGSLADTFAWERDPYTVAVKTHIDSSHVRASAAIPFLFPAVRIDDEWYFDGGLRVNTPLSPALRLGADRLLVVALRNPPDIGAPAIATAEQAISQPAFLLGKVLNILMVDQLEHELRRLEMLNTLIDGASDAFGSTCLERINAATRAKRGVEYRKVDTVVVRPSADISALASDAYRNRRDTSLSRGVLAFLLARTALLGVPDKEADLLSYIYFDASYTTPLFDLGHDDAHRLHREIVEMLTRPRAEASCVPCNSASEPA